MKRGMLTMTIGPRCGLLIVLMLLLAACSAKPGPEALEQARGAFNELRAVVRQEVKDPKKAAEVVVLVDRLEQVMLEAGEARKAHAAAIRRLNANYDATEKEFRAMFADFNAKQQTRQDRLLVIDQRARELMTEQEWKNISRDVARALDASARAELGL